MAQAFFSCFFVLIKVFKIFILRNIVFSSFCNEFTVVFNFIIVFAQYQPIPPLLFTKSCRFLVGRLMHRGLESGSALKEMGWALAFKFYFTVVTT